MTMSLSVGVFVMFAVMLQWPCAASIFCAISLARLACVLPSFHRTFGWCLWWHPGHLYVVIQKFTFFPVGGVGEIVQRDGSSHDGSASTILAFCAVLSCAVIAMV